MIENGKLLLALILFALSSCTATQQTINLPLEEPSAPTPKMIEVDSELNGMSPERLDRIRPLMQKYVDDEQVGGMISMIYRKDKVVHEEYYGYRNVDRKLPMDKDTIFRIYSMTKPIASVAALTLYEEGHFLLSDPIHKYLPELKDLKIFDAGAEDGSRARKPNRPVIIRDLLTHTSGFSYGIFGNSPVDSLYWKARPLQAQNFDDLLERMASLPLMNEPGEKFLYGVSTDVLGVLIERVSGVPFFTYLDEKIFQPLGMKNTRFSVDQSELSRFSVNYRWNRQGDLVVADSGRTSQYMTPRAGYNSGGGGLVSTIDDYLKFTRMLLNRGELDGTRILGSKTVDLMASNHLKQGDFEPGWGFGLGVRVNTDPAKAMLPTSKGMYGWGGLANTYFFIDPEEEMIGMVWTQVFPNGYFPLRNQFVTATYQAIIE